ncbi:hypothetical protein V6N12_012967 [Hibiscus sabdariffa]|uniref:RNase H type-1 domain-containing protein n=1 Tax=Hibiscus sabdariffa TaxID=183260 RepID=A0ABR2EFY1_9ROSI
MVGLDGECLWHEFVDLLPHHLVLHIVAIKPPPIVVADDLPGWNRCIFAPDKCVSDSLLQQCLRLRNGTLHAFATQPMPRSLVPPENVVRRWSKPPQGWIKVNTDGACNPSTGFACCGGVGRDENMLWCFGYSKKIGICSTYDAKLWAIYEGLLTAWSLGYSKVIIETDNKEAYMSLFVNNPMLIALSLRAHFASMLNRDWEVRFEWVGRECNMVVDRLAKAAMDFSFDYHRFLDPPPFVVEMLNVHALVEP